MPPSVPGADPLDPLLLLLAAMVIDAYLPDLVWFYRLVPHPRHLAERAAAFFDRRLNRENRKARDRLWRGGLTAAILAAGGLLAGWALQALGRQSLYAEAAELALVVSLLGLRAVHDGLRATWSALRGGDLAAARLHAARLTGFDTGHLDAHGVARAAIEGGIRGFGRDVVGPAFWFAAAGLPGLLAYRALTVLADRVGAPIPRYQAFGRVAVRLDAGLGWIPARLAGLYLALGALFVPRGHPLRALAAWGRGGILAAGAEGLGLALGGPRRLGAVTVAAPWLGRGSARAETGDLRRALRLYLAACLLNALPLALWAMIRLA